MKVQNAVHRVFACYNNLHFKYIIVVLSDECMDSLHSFLIIVVVSVLILPVHLLMVQTKCYFSDNLGTLPARVTAQAVLPTFLPN